MSDTEQTDQLTIEEADAFLEQMMPDYPWELRIALITLMGELIQSGTPNGLIWAVGPNDDGRSILVEVRYEDGSNAAESLAQAGEDIDYLLTMLAHIEAETDDPDIHSIIKAARQGVVSDCGRLDTAVSKEIGSFEEALDYAVDAFNRLSPTSENLKATSRLRRLKFIMRNAKPEDAETIQKIGELEHSVGFHRVRHDAFTKWARTLPDPYQQQAFEILANGFYLTETAVPQDEQ